MASDDIYLRRDVYTADQRALIAEIRLGNEAVIKELNTRFSTLEAQFNTRFNKLETQFNKLEAQVVVLRGRIDAIESRIGGVEQQIASLQNYVSMGIAFIALIIGLSVFLAPITKIVSRFLKPQPNPQPQPQPQPTITIEQIEALIDAKLAAR